MRRVRSIKGGMDKANQVVEKALRKAGLREKELDRKQNLVYRDPEFFPQAKEK